MTGLALADMLITGIIEYSLAMQKFNQLQAGAIAEQRDLNSEEIEQVKSYLKSSREGLEAEIARRESQGKG